MKNLQFQNYIYNFTGGTSETNQYFFDLPALLRCEVPIEDNLREDPIDEEESATIEEGNLIETACKLYRCIRKCIGRKSAGNTKHFIKKKNGSIKQPRWQDTHLCCVLR